MVSIIPSQVFVCTAVAFSPLPVFSSPADRPAYVPPFIKAMTNPRKISGGFYVDILLDAFPIGNLRAALEVVAEAHEIAERAHDELNKELDAICQTL